MAPESPPRFVWGFGPFELDPGTGELRRSGLAVHLPPQALRVLSALLQKPGEVVSRDELRRLLWGEQTFVDFDHSLNFCLSRVRGALDDDARRPRFVATVPGRGYRFIAPVRSRPVPSSPVETTPPAPGPPARSHRRRWLAALAAVLALSLLPASPSPAPRDPLAQALHAEARALCGTAGWRRSVSLYREALARDPRFAAAHAGLAESYLALGEEGSLAPGQAFPAAGDAAQRALALEERADAHLVLGRVRLAYEWDWEGTESEVRRTLALDPSSVRGWVAQARLLSARGDPAGAVVAAQRAEALDPSAPEAVEELAWCYYRARRLDEAARQFRLVAERRPEEAHHRLFGLFRQAGRDREALQEAEAVMRGAGVPAGELAALGTLAPRDAAAAYLRGTVAYLRREASRHRVPPERFALLYADLGEPRAALDWLSRAAEERSPGLVITLVDPTLDPLRAEPEFVRLLRRVGSPVGTRSS